MAKGWRNGDLLEWKVSGWVEQCCKQTDNQWWVGSSRSIIPNPGDTGLIVARHPTASSPLWVIFMFRQQEYITVYASERTMRRVKNADR